MHFRRPLCLVCMVIMGILFIISKFTPPVPSDDLLEYSNKTLIVTGEVADKQIKNDNLCIFLKNTNLYINNSTKQNIQNSLKVPDDSNSYERADIKTDGLVIYLSSSKYVDEIKLGSTLQVKGVYEPFDVAYNEGQFDARSYYKIKGYDGKLVRARVQGMSKQYSHVKEALRYIRTLSENVINSKLDDREAGVLIAMLLGDKNELDADVKEQYQVAGISHVLALSGLHIAAIGLGLLRFLKKLNVNQLSASIVASITVFLYSIMTGLSTSTVRAMIMFSLALLAEATRRSYDLLSAASLSAIIILITNPGYLYDAGFLLSFGAIVGIGCVYPVLEQLTRSNNAIHEKSRAKSSGRDMWNCIKTCMDKLRQSVCISLSITLVTLPVVAYNFFQISKYSIFLNLIVIPLMGAVLATGFAGIATGLLEVANYSIISGLGRGMSPIIFKITDVILKIYNALSLDFAGFSSNLVVLGRPKVLQTVMYIIMIIFLTVAGDIFCKNRAFDRHGLIILSNNIRNVTKSKNKIARATNYGKTEAAFVTKSKQTLMKAAFIKCVILIMYFIACAILCFRTKDEFVIKNIFVGQGDCTLIYGKDIPTIMIDGGSTDVKSVAKYRIIPVLKSNGLNNIDYCIVTHMDADHVNGIEQILDDNLCGINIDNIILSESYAKSDEAQEDMKICKEYELMREEDNDLSSIIKMISGNKNEDYYSDIYNSKGTYSKMLAASSRGKTKLHYIKAGDVISAGRLRMECLSPEPDKVYDGNDSSIVVQFDYASGVMTGIFTGDISIEQENAIIDKLSHVNYLKVAHHGSRNSSGEDFLDKITPDIAVISAGIDNSYGHPHAETLDRISKYAPNVRLYRLDECGQVSIVIGDGSFVTGRCYLKGCEKELD